VRRALRPAVLLGLLVGATGGWSAVADPAKKDDPTKDAASSGAALRYARGYADALAEAKDRGCVVFLTFHGDG
jgi:hypothetical protein